MTQPYKICPACGQPAVLSMPVCRRCGRPYVPPPAPGVYLPQSLPIAPDAPPWQGTSRRKQGVLFGVLAAAVLAGVVLLFSLRPSERSGPPRTGSSGLTQSSGPFTERWSDRETPTINVTSLARDAATCVFRDRDGNVYSLRAEPGKTSSLPLPAGDYTFQIVPANPQVYGQSGSATFRRFRAYDLTMVTDTYRTVPDNAHIGDQ